MSPNHIGVVKGFTGHDSIYKELCVLYRVIMTILHTCNGSKFVHFLFYMVHLNPEVCMFKVFIPDFLDSL